MFFLRKRPWYFCLNYIGNKLTHVPAFLCTYDNTESNKENNAQYKSQQHLNAQCSFFLVAGKQILLRVRKKAVGRTSNSISTLKESPGFLAASRNHTSCSHHLFYARDMFFSSFDYMSSWCLFPPEKLVFMLERTSGVNRTYVWVFVFWRLSSLRCVDYGFKFKTKQHSVILDEALALQLSCCKKFAENWNVTTWPINRS